MCVGFLRRCRRMCCRRCMRRQSLISPSHRPTLSPNTTDSSSVPPHPSASPSPLPSIVLSQTPLPHLRTSLTMYAGIPTRFGNFPAQWKTFWDSTGGLWVKQSLAGKMFGTFVSTGTPGGGQEITAFQSLSVAVHQGMVYVPLGYQVGDITNLDEVHGGSPWVCFLFHTQPS